MSLLASLTRGFIDHTAPTPSEKLLPALLINERAQGKTVLSSVLRHLGECEEFWITVAFATKSGVATLLNVLLELEANCIPGRVLVSQYLDFTQPEALRALLQFSNIELKIATRGNLHAKGYLFQKKGGYDLIIGSSNLTASALKTNKEWNLQVSATAEADLLRSVQTVFNQEFTRATPVDQAFLASYQLQYAATYRVAPSRHSIFLPPPAPNAMQVEALANLAALRRQAQRKALLISATGTGKTYLAAFDAQQANAKKLLFVVHRTTIAQAALRTFQRVFGSTRTLGLYTNTPADLTVDFLFCTVQTLAQSQHLGRFSASHFDYLVLDETHRSGAESYQRLLTYFEPVFLLGMTATPERTDGYDIFQHFDHNIAYEIRLQQALAEDMLCPFHYFGVTDISVGGQELAEHTTFSFLTAQERVNHILEKARFYGCDNGRVRGLVFCRTIAESHALSLAFNAAGLRTLALDGSSSEVARAAAIERLESDEDAIQLDYLFTVDIFNEGIDIPRLNQIILLRPTQSAIVFVQQLGRGLRKTAGKSYLTVLDFIGNYASNYLIPVALFGDSSYNKDTLRKLLAAGSTLLPGTSTINFDRIAQDRIYASLDKAQLNTKRELLQAYKLLKFTIGRPPLMMDFMRHAARDPFLYVTYAGSFFNFAIEQEEAWQGVLSPAETTLLALISTHLANGKRIEEVELLALLLTQEQLSFPNFLAHVQATYGTASATLLSCLRNINFEFIRNTQEVVTCEEQVLRLAPAFAAMTAKPLFRQFLQDVLCFAQARYRTHQAQSPFFQGFFLYQKYSRRDVCRLLNWELDESATVFGYKLKDNDCPLFINYHKAEDIAQSTKYADGFASPQEFHWMSKSNRKLTSPEIVAMQQGGLRLPLFIKKSNGEGTDFYYMGEVVPTQFRQAALPTGEDKSTPVVQVSFTLTPAVEEGLYEYLTRKA